MQGVMFTEVSVAFVGKKTNIISCANVITVNCSCQPPDLRLCLILISLGLFAFKKLTMVSKKVGEQIFSLSNKENNGSKR